MSIATDSFANLIVDRERSALVLDFDGVLSPIVDDPTESRLPDQTRRTLQRIAEYLPLVAIVSGRPLEFLVERASIPNVRLIGSYGAETLEEGHRSLDREVEAWLPVIKTAREELEKIFYDISAGIYIEPKSVSVAAHWRKAVDKDAAQERVAAAIDRIAVRTGLRVHDGKMVKELCAPVDINKGTVMQFLSESRRIGTWIYCGDDIGDLPAFEFVAQAGGHAVLVKHGDETDERLEALATTVFGDTNSLAESLEATAVRLSS